MSKGGILMLSVGRIDGRKGLGFGVGGEMEEAELEEGEASCYQDDDAGMERDVALSSLSYIVRISFLC